MRRWPRWLRSDNAGWILLVPAFLLSLTVWIVLLDAQNGNDLRNRIVAARAVEKGLNPYDLNSLNNGALPPPELADPMSWLVGFSASTAPPPVVALYSLYMHGPWQEIRLFWMSAEIMAFAAILLLLSIGAPNRRVAGWAACLTCLVIGTAYTTAFHFDLGQYYFYPTLLLAAELVLLWRGAKWGGMFLGLAAVFRPHVLLITPALWILGRWRAALVACVVAGAIIGPSVLSRPDLWHSLSELTGRWVKQQYYGTAFPFLVKEMPLANMEAAVALARQDGYPSVPWVPTEPPPEGVYNTYRMGFTLSPGRWRMAIYLMNWKLASISIGGFLSVALALMALKCRKDRRREMSIAVLSASLMIADMASPVFGVYYLVMSTPAVAYIVTVALRERAGALLLGLLPVMVMMAVPSYHPAVICLFVLVLLAYRLATAADRPAWRIDRWLRWWPFGPRGDATGPAQGA